MIGPYEWPDSFVNFHNRASINSLFKRRVSVFRWDIVWQFLFSSFIIQAAWTTLWISVVAQLSGVIIGLFLALMRMSRFPILSRPAGAYVWFFRGSPLLVQVLLLWDGLPKLVPSLLLP